jgi:hypothetical protein
MAAAEAPYDHLPVELRPPNRTQSLEITPNSYVYSELFLMRLVLCRGPTYAIAHNPMISHPPWPPPTTTYASVSALTHPYNNTNYKTIIYTSHVHGLLVLDMTNYWMNFVLRCYLFH